MSSRSSLPTKLAREPIVDAVFEVRFGDRAPASAILPGLIFQHFKPDEMGDITSLPAAQIPENVRLTDPNLTYLPLTRMRKGNTLILFGDRMIGIAMTMPYPGWSIFKSEILEIFAAIRQAPVFKTVERCAIKYVDIFEKDDSGTSPLSKLNIQLRFGESDYEKREAVLRCEVVRGDFVHVVQAATNAKVQQIDGQTREGLILDIDTAYPRSTMSCEEFFDALPSISEDVHTQNKEMFFELLSESGLASLEPFYELGS